MHFRPSVTTSPFYGKRFRGWISVSGREWRLLETGLCCQLLWMWATVSPGQTLAGPVTAQVQNVTSVTSKPQLAMFTFFVWNVGREWAA